MRITYTLAYRHIIELVEKSNVTKHAISHANKSYADFVTHEGDIIQMELYSFYLDFLQELKNIKFEIVRPITNSVKINEKKALLIDQFYLLTELLKRVGFIFDDQTIKSINIELLAVQNLLELISEKNDIENIELKIIEVGKIISFGNKIIKIPPLINKQIQLRMLFYKLVKNVCDGENVPFNENKRILNEKLSDFSAFGIQTALLDLKAKILAIKEYEIKDNSFATEMFLGDIQILITSLFNDIFESKRLKNEQGLKAFTTYINQIKRLRAKNKRYGEGAFCQFCQEAPCECSDPFKD
jgi:hypothetical protein